MAQPYLSLEAEWHDLFWNAEDPRSEVALMASFLKKHPGRSLEIGSGSGRLLLPLFKQGFEIEGLELSEDMLRLCRQDCLDEPIQPILHHGDMTVWGIGQQFSALLAPAFTLQLAPDPEVALQHWRTLLQVGGGLYLTVFMPYAELLNDLPENEWYIDHQLTLPDGNLAKIETRHSIDQAQRKIFRTHRYSLSGSESKSFTSEQTIRWIEHQEMLWLLERCSFECQSMFLDFDPKHFTQNPDAENFGGIMTYEISAI